MVQTWWRHQGSPERRTPFLKMKGNVKERSTFKGLGRCKTWLYAGILCYSIRYRVGENPYRRVTSRKPRRGNAL
ncbi:MAG: hypothetical protein DRP81_05820 [Candidatus Omnitrophota bacterium]|nr:MAG: hypothetical protein DRP81_05820 [Candidatus Omnitrophota bacterium]